MPFHDEVYYPFTSELQGTHSSAGVPSLLSSPLSQQQSGMTPSSGVSSGVPFRFRPRRESVDWRRINAVDVDAVVCQLDVDALQEHISTVTFCSLDGERCPRCQAPVDPALVKLLRLAQLTVEWLLHCQNFLSSSLRAAEDRMVAGGKEREELLAQLKKQEETVKALTAELKQRKKMIRNQQTMLAPRIVSSHKCAHCDKSFLNAGFLQNHMQRRHPDEYHAYLQSDGRRTPEIDSLKLEINKLKQEIVQQQQTLARKVAQEKEQQSMHNDLQRELDRFRAEEMARMDRKIEDSRDDIRREMEFFYSRNIQTLNDVNQNKINKDDKQVSSVSSQPEKDVNTNKEAQLHFIHKLEHQMKKQDKKWHSRLHEIKNQHMAEKKQLLEELNKLQLSVSEQRESSSRLQQEMMKKLKEKDQTIKVQREQIKTICTNPPTKIVEVPVIRSAPEPKPKKVVVEKPVSALILDPIQEMSEEDKECSNSAVTEDDGSDYRVHLARLLKRDSSISERKKKPKPERKPKGALKLNPSLRKEIRMELEHNLSKKLEALGIKHGQSGVSKTELGSLLSRLLTKREMVAKTMPDYWRHREDIICSVEDKLGVKSRGMPASAPAAQTGAKQSSQVLQIRPRASSLPSGYTHAPPHASVKLLKTPEPAPRLIPVTQPKTSTPNTKAPPQTKTAVPSSDESEDEETEDTEPPKQPNGKHEAVRPALSGTGRGAAVLTRQDELGHFFKAPQTQMPAPAPKPPETDEEEGWSDISEVQEIMPKEQKSQNGHAEKKSIMGEKVNVLAKKIEQNMAQRVVKKPAGALSILPERKDEVEELSLTDLEESSEWMVSSIEEQHDAPRPAKKSQDSPSTSVWGTSTGKGSKSGLTEAGTGSTFKSSLCSLSDISDSSDLGKKH